MAPDAYTIDTADELRAVVGEAHPMMYDKSMSYLDDHIRRFLALTSLVIVASVDAEGHMDVSPKGDPPGFIHVLDDATIAIPERAGNRRADTFANVLSTGSVALICIVPGMDETMRISGSASISADPELLATMEVEGHRPSLALVVRVEEAFIHCGKAFKRGQVWDPESFVDRSAYPSVGEVMFDHGDLSTYGYTRESTIDCAADDYATNMYPVADAG